MHPKMLAFMQDITEMLSGEDASNGEGYDPAFAGKDLPEPERESDPVTESACEDADQSWTVTDICRQVTDQSWPTWHGTTTLASADDLPRSFQADHHAATLPSPSDKLPMLSEVGEWVAEAH